MRVKITKSLTVFIYSLIALFFVSCRTLHVEDDAILYQGNDVMPDGRQLTYNIYENLDEKPLTENERYIFVRLYYPEYDNPVSIENLLKACIKAADVYDLNICHSSIGFDLNDNFYGLTTGGKHNLKFESCTNPQTNSYMKKCNKYRSTQITYAIKVSVAEYEKAKTMVEEFYKNPRTRYDIFKNLVAGFYGLERHNVKTDEEAAFATKPHKHSEVSFKENKYDFVCSTFIAYVLANSVDSIHDFFVEKQINVDYVFPSDLAFIPGMKKLFSSVWIDYDVAARYYSKQYLSFEPYYKEYIVSE